MLRDDPERSMPWKERFNVTVPLEMRGTACLSGPQEEAWVSARKQKGARRKPRVTAFIVCFSGKARQGRTNSLGFTNLNNFSRLWVLGTAARYLVPGSGSF